MTLDWDGLRTAIRVERTRRNWTQGDLAGRMELSITTLKNVEGGRAYRKPPIAALQAIDRAFEWPVGTCESILRDSGTVPESATTAVESAIAETPLPLPPLKDRLPKRFQMALDHGDIVDVDMWDLTIGEGTRMITILLADPNSGPRNPEELRRTMREWERAKRLQRGLKPLAWEPGDPEEWKSDPGG